LVTITVRQWPPDSLIQEAQNVTEIIEQAAQSDQPPTSGKIRMTEAMKEGLDALQREYEAFVESSIQTLAFMNDLQTRTK
jgi:hypothetical protein